jgi:hypothetical protein
MIFKREEVTGLQFGLSHTSKQDTIPICHLGFQLFNVPKMSFISCPMVAIPLLMTQGLGNHSRAYDYWHGNWDRRLTKSADMLHIPQSPVQTTFHSQHGQTTAPIHQICQLEMSAHDHEATAVLRYDLNVILLRFVWLTKTKLNSVLYCSILLQTTRKNQTRTHGNRN